VKKAVLHAQHAAGEVNSCRIWAASFIACPLSFLAMPGLLQIKFHQCVRLASFERDRTISFIPPDGAFDLM